MAGKDVRMDTNSGQWAVGCRQFRKVDDAPL